MGNAYKSQGKKGLFDEHFSTTHLSNMGNPLESISNVIDFELFRSVLESRLLNTFRKNNAGAKPFDVVMMFKILILQRYYNLGDRQVEYQIVDRTSFKKFLGLETGDKVPDEKTVWSFRERLTQSGTVEDLFELFVFHLNQKGLIFNEGQIIDASFTEIPRQRNTREENKIIKDESGDDLWNDNPNKKSHKDIDARWTKKNGDTFYGYKNHVKVDAKSKIIGTYYVSDASVHDSQVLDLLLTEKDQDQNIFADSAYTGPVQEGTISEHKMINNVHEKGYKNKPLTEEQKSNNTIKSKTRARVEHIFGFMERSMNGMYIWSVGMPRATAIIGLMNLTYNIFRYEQLVR
ncbi:MAG: IS5 family transposase [Mariniphaga sp.]|nr:IS5 family transposase [Mariniphaga sp.]